MDGDRKYRQRGYQDTDRGAAPHLERRPPGPKPSLDITGPKLPRLVENLVASRCFSCGVTLAPGIDFAGQCHKCHADLHCCKQCVNFDPSARFQCIKPVPIRIPLKDKANTCELFSPRVTVARDALPSGGMGRPAENGSIVAPRNPNDARAAFDSLFKK